MKLHLREVRAGGRLFRVVTPRPGTDVLFSTNYFHGTWHVVTDAVGACMIARLLWGLAYQCQPGTVALLHGELMRPTPFDADPSDPVLLVPAHLTGHDRKALGELRRRLALPGPCRTIRWRTFGLEQRLGRDNPRPDNGEWALLEQQWIREHCTRVGGFICYSALPEVLKYRAVAIHHLGQAPRVSSYVNLAERGAGPSEGEIQTFPDYRRQLSQAALARREVLGELETPVDPETLRERVWRQKMLVEARS
jgi:hypothetical protein